jgi:hypothetical protein
MVFENEFLTAHNSAIRLVILKLLPQNTEFFDNYTG